jgi:23S rRNA (uracil1939-C5)-methyltransferase/tRNA (uracil-5-)-methyltransferase
MRAHKKFVPFPFEFHQELEVDIDSLSNLGAGVAKVDIPAKDDAQETRKWVIFIPMTLPGDRALIRIFRNDSNCSHGELVKVLKPSSNRVDPKCKLFGKCGGCQ